MSIAYWNETTILQELQIYIDSKNGEFPSLKIIKQERADLGTAIVRHGGINYYREKLGFSVLSKSPGTKTEEYVIEEIHKVIDALGNFPTQHQLNARGLGGLRSDITSLGGFSYFRDKMGFNPVRFKPKVQWNEDEILEGLNSLTQKFGEKFPSCAQIKQANPDLLKALTQTGKGLCYWKHRLK